MSRSGFQPELGLAVRERRKELGLTQEQMANESGLHQRWISNIESAERSPNLENLRRLADALGLRASELLERAERLERSGSAGART